MADVKELSIKIKANTQSATQSLEKLGRALGQLSGQLNTVNSGQLNALSSNLGRFADAASKLSAVKKADFTRLVKSVNSLASIDAQGVSSAANAIQTLTSSLSTVNSGNITQLSTDLGNLGVGIRSLGYKTTTQAIQNLPQLTVALSGLINAMSTMPAVSQNTIDFVNALGRLSASGSGVRSAVNGINSALNQQNRATRQASQGTASLAATIGKLYAAYFWVVRLTKAFISFTNSAMDTYEALNYFNVAIDKVASSSMDAWKQFGYDSADAYYNSFSDRMSSLIGQMSGYSVSGKNMQLLDTSNLGMNVSELTQASASFIQIADSIGMVGESSLNTAKALTMLSADWASLRNISTSDAMNKMESALVGQSRAVRSLGIDITMVALQEQAYELGLNKSTAAMTQQEKSLLRVITMLKQSKVAYGDLAKTIDSPANQLRMLQAAFSNLARTIGSLFLPVLSTVLPYVTGVTIALNRMLVALGNFLGVDWSQNISSLKGASDSLELLETDMENAAGASDKMNKSLRGWDEINNLSTSQSSSGGSLADSTELLDGELAKALAEYEEKWNKAFDNMDSKAKAVADTLTKLGENEVFQTLAVGLGAFLIALGAFKVGAWALTALDALRTNLFALNGIPKSLNFAIQIAGVVVAIKFLNNTADNVVEDMKEQFDGITWDEIFENARIALGDGLGTLWANTLQTFSSDYGIVQNFDEWIEALFTKDTWDDVYDNWETGWNTIGGIIERGWNKNVAPWFTKKKWEELFNNAIKGIQNKWVEFEDWWNKLAIVKWWNESVAPWFTKKRWEELWNTIKLAAETKWNALKEWFDNIWFVRWFNDIKTKFSLSNVLSWFANLKTGFEQIWNGAISAAKEVWNGFARWLNEKLTFTMDPIEIAGKTVFEGGTIKLANLPTYSVGGFPEDGLFMANHNELVGSFNGKSAVVNNEQIIEGIKQGVYEAMMSANGNGNVTVEIDGKEVFSVVQKQSKRYTKMTGVPAF